MSARAEVHVVVVDNNSDRSALNIVKAYEVHSPFPIIYRHETRPGISYARNTAISAVPDADFVVFIDDDEIPNPRWLDELLDASFAYSAEIVCGPVVPDIFAGAPKWLVAGGFFDRPRYPTGRILKPCEARTGNVLIWRPALLRMNPVFHPDLALSGGEDTHFFYEMVQAGHKIVWADRAIVTEKVPASRANVSWLLRRAYGYGNTRVAIENLLRGTGSPSADIILRGLSRLGKGLLAVPMRATAGRAGILRSLQQAADGLGVLAACAQFRFYAYEYRRTNNTSASDTF